MNVCDICGIERKIFEKKGMDFEFHKEIEHNLWDYVFYLVHLHTLDKQSLTGFEYFVLTKFKEMSTVWLPVGSTTFLKTIEAADEGISQLQKQMKDANTALEARMDQRFSIVLDSIKELKALVIKTSNVNMRHHPSFDELKHHEDYDTHEKMKQIAAQPIIDDKDAPDTERTSSRRR